MKSNVFAALILAVCGSTIGLVVGLLVLRPSHSELQVSSEPPGASIYLNQKFQGVTPKTLSPIPKGEHHLRLACTGYHDENRSVTVDSGKSSIQLLLRPIPPKGRLVVQSTPPGAYVWLDGERGQQTPTRIDDVALGIHEITVEKSGWLSHKETVELTEKGVKQISVKLVSVKVAYYLDAIEKSPDNTTHYVELGRIYLRTGDLENGFQTLLKAVQAFGRRGSAFDKGFGELLTTIRIARPDFDDGRWQQLIKGLKDGLYNREPDDRFASSVHGFFAEIEQWKEVVDIATYYLTHGKSKSLYYQWRLVAWANLGREQEIMQDLQAMIDAMPEQARKQPIAFQIYYALQQLHRWKELFLLCNAYTEWQPDAILPRLYKLEALGQLGETAKFDSDFHLLAEAFRKDPKSSVNYGHLRPILVKLERWAAMAESCRIFYEAQPEDLMVRFWYLEALLQTADWKSTLQMFQALADEGHLGEQKPNQWGTQPEALEAVLFSGAWAMMELGEFVRLEKLLKQYEFDPQTHFWTSTIRGELWRRRPGGDPPKPWLEVKPCANPPEVDGRLDDEAWAAAGRSSAFLNLHHPGKNEEMATVLATWDDRQLYLGIIGHGQNREGRHPVALDMYPNRRLELFIDPDADYRTYKQFMFSVKGPILNFDCIRGAFDRGNGLTEKWQPEFKLVVDGEGEDHVYELAIPFSTLEAPTPRAGNVWGFNLIYLGTNSVTFASLGSGFHQPLRFGFLLYR